MAAGFSAAASAVDSLMDTQLMTNYIAAAPVDDIADFVPVYDETHFPMMFYQEGATNDVYLVSRNSSNGQVSDKVSLTGLRNPGAPGWLPEKRYGPAATFTAIQDPVTSKASVLVVGIVSPDGRTKLEGEPDYYISLLGPWSPEEFKGLTFSALQSQDWGINVPPSGKITKAHLGKPHGSSALPCMALTLNVDGKETMLMYDEKSNAFPVLDTTSVENTRQIQMPPGRQNPNADNNTATVEIFLSSIIGMHCGTVMGKQGMWVLRHHKANWNWVFGIRPTRRGGPHAGSHVTETGQAYFLDLDFYAREPDGSISRNSIAMPFECSVGALTTTTTDKARMTMLHNPTTGHDDLMLICESGLYHLAGETNYQLKLLSQDQSLKTSSFVHASQNGDDVRLWSASNNEHAYLGYTRLSFNDLSSAPDSGMNLQLVPFTDNHEDAIGYRALCTSSNGAYDQHFLRLSKDAVVDVVSQSQQTGLWSKSQSFFTAPHISKYIEVKSYTTQIAFESDMINPIRSLKVSIAGSATTIWLNGEKHTIAPSAPVEIEIPSAVTLNIVQESTDLSARAFTVLDNGTKKEYKSDPAKMNSEKLKQLSTVDGLKSAGVNADEATLKETATRIDNLCKQGDALDSGNMSVHEMGFGSWLEEKWHWIEEKGAEVIHEIKQVAGTAWVIVYKVVDEFKELAIDSWHAIARTASAIFDGIKWAWNEVAGFFGAVFDWAKIKDRTIEINKQMKAVIKYGEFLMDATIDELVHFVRLYVKAIEKNVDATLDMVASIENPAIDRINNPDDNGGHFRESAKMSIFTTALNKGAPLPKNAADASSSSSNAIQDKIKSLSGSIDVGPQPKQRLKDLIHDVGTAMTVPVKLNNIIAVLKDVFKLAVELVESGIDLILDLLKEVIHVFVDLLTENIEIPIITPLLRWLTGSESGFDLPSPLTIVSFIMGVASVELEAFGILQLKDDEFSIDIASTLEDQALVQNDINAWFSAHAPASGSPVVAMDAMSTGANSLEASASEDPPNSGADASDDEPKESDSSKAYTRRTAIGHPCILATHTVLACLNAFGTGYRLMESSGIRTKFKAGQKPSLGNTVNLESAAAAIGVIEKIDFAAAIVDIALTCPPRMERPQRTAMIASYSISSVASIVALIGSIAAPLIPGETGKIKLIFAGLQFYMGMGKMAASSIAQHAQDQPISKDDPNHGGWAIPDQQDPSILHLTIGNIVCSAVTSLAELTVAGGDFFLEEAIETEDPVLLLAAMVALGVGSSTDVLVSIPDLVIDSIKSNRERNELAESNKGAYTGGSRR